MEMEFYRCNICGQMVAIVKGTGAPLICCGQEMEKLVPNTVDASREKHVPVYTIEGNKITVVVGEEEHPMTEEHYIEWIALKTKQGSQRKGLMPGDAPKACFTICEDDEVQAIYEYCNIHSLWAKFD